MFTTPAEFEKFADDLALRIADRLAQRPRLVDRYELSRQTGLSVPTIDRRKKDGSIPFMKIGNRVLFDPSAVVAALSRNHDAKR